MGLKGHLFTFSSIYQMIPKVFSKRALSLYGVPKVYPSCGWVWGFDFNGLLFLAGCVMPKEALVYS